MSLSTEYLEHEDIENGADGTFWSDEIICTNFNLVSGYQASPRAFFDHHRTRLFCPGGHWEFFNDVRFQSRAKNIGRV